MKLVTSLARYGLVLRLGVILQLCKVSAPTTEIRLGALLPIGRAGFQRLGESLQYIIEPAIQHVYREGILDPKEYNITYTVADSACNKLQAVEHTYNLRSVDAFIGPACTEGCLAAGLLAANLNKPMISYSCSSLDLGKREFYYTFARTQPFTRTYYDTTPKLLMHLMQFYKWEIAGIIVNEDNLWTPIASALNAYLKGANMTVGYYGVYTISKDFEHKSVLEYASRFSRVIFLITHSYEVAKFLVAADKLGMRNGEFAFITLDFTVSSKWYNEPWSPGKEKLLKIFDGIFNLAVKKPHGVLFENFTKDFKQHTLERMGIPAAQITLEFGAYFFDAIVLYAKGLNLTLGAGGNITNGTKILNYITSNRVLFNGMSGSVAIDRSGNRVPVFVFNNRQDGQYEAAFEVDLTADDRLMVNNATVVWPGGSTIVPKDRPRCGFDGNLCGDEGVSSLWFLLILLIIPIMIACVGIIYYRRKAYEKDLLMNRSWIIKYGDIHFCDPSDKRSQKMRSRAVSVISSLGASHVIPVASNLGRYMGELVSVKKIYKKSVTVTRELLVEIKQVRDLVTANLNPCIGVCVESPNICIVSQYCHRGSLQDLLGNDDIKLDWMFKLSFATDIAAGMAAIHASPLRAHGNLKSSNCLIDSRWVCRVCDYGLDLLKEDQEDKEIGEHAEFRDLFWTAPELLCWHDSANSHFHKTQSGDVYSYGIILNEILTRDEPYISLMLCHNPKEIVEKIKKQLVPAIRPDIPKSADDENSKYVDLMIRCWDGAPTVRPPFPEIKKVLRAINKGKTTNIVDNMIRMMERYTDQLEDIVDERTKQLAIEKAKTDELLYKMLPKPIAEDLKMGKTVKAESFQSVTIFFSDIVGFTSLAAQSTPMQVVDFLNDLYTLFDNVIDTHDVYKVETIGDAYMVVSGLPVPNGNRHAGEIATMALNLLSSTRDFQVRHMPHKRIHMRIGLHTGPCVSGVVGTKMPRYCLFGDTVNYASRMESNGVALRVHISPECKEALDALGGYYLEERGPVVLKGKGTIVTYFLNGKDGFDKPLPELQP